ncbi:uncharacterized protein EV422DRAFT_571794 [Fimicolochytrium jonesii]|uniref:uncharacterized protein n=1 Tax=Fimicolochytrium jonesii TaxID=1396493 RepID=UPI0022FEB3B6|nr:uncharacterized protein EV422DRAFT_571794 [Fimicolochytrium jonesii]KAI8816410.1 hypothetical protein EV422DRAFT_571794 [Fimicolochytrium jonesii]
MPRKVVAINNTAAFSGGHAWEHLEAIVQFGPRPYNSDANLRTLAYLEHVVREARALGIALGKDDDWIEISAPDTTNLNVNLAYYQSSNLVVRIKGSSNTREALLVSAHYDSAPLSYGVTDDGIGIVAMLDIVRALVHGSTLDHDVILNFNNGEEMSLYGGYALLQHPWFQDIKGFINLEGTGTAGKTRSLLFRTNSYELADVFAKSAPYPHASVLADDLMGMVGSDTDYRPYAGAGQLPGIDISFYAHRYLYHTLHDDLAHADPTAVQQMGDNVLSTLRSVCNSDLLTRISSTIVEKEEQDSLPNGGFVYYDFLGRRMVMTTAGLYKAGMSFLLVAIALGSGMKGMAEARRYGVKRGMRRYVKPIVEAYLLVVLNLFTTLFVVLLLSKLKSLLNYGATYGNPHLSLAWIAAAVALVILQMQAVWPWIALRLKLRKAPVVVYNLLPTTTDRFEEEDEETGERYEGLAYDPDELDGHSDDDEDDEDEDEDDDPTTPNPSAPLLHPTTHTPNNGITRRTGRTKAEVPAGPSLHTWIPYGLLCFWWSTLFLALALSDRKIMGAYVLYDYAFFSALAVALNVSLGALIRKWWRADIAEDNPPLPQWKQTAVRAYERYAWVLAMLVSSLIPTLELFDILDLVITAIPSLIAESLPETVVDLALTLLILPIALNLMPALNRSRIHRKALVYIAAALFTPLYISALWRFPFSQDRPQKLGFMETWDVTTPALARTSQVQIVVAGTMRASHWAASLKEESEMECDDYFPTPPPPTRPSAPTITQGVCYLADTEPPVVVAADGSGAVPPADLIRVKDLRRGWDAQSGVGYVEGVFEGPPGARACTVDVAHSLPEGVVDGSMEVEIGDTDEGVTWVDVDEVPRGGSSPPSPKSKGGKWWKWATQDASPPTSGTTTTTTATHQSVLRTLYRRAFTDPKQTRVVASFKVTYNATLHALGVGEEGMVSEPPQARISCFLNELNVSRAFEMLTRVDDDTGRPTVDTWAAFGHSFWRATVPWFAGTRGMSGGVAVVRRV